MFEIIPSPGTENKTFKEIEKKIASLRPFAQTIHIDICDGKFAPNTTFSDPEPFKKFTKLLPENEGGWETGEKGLFFEVHLMLEDPIKELKERGNSGFARCVW